MSKSNEKILLPFAAFSQETKGFDNNTEEATVFCISELNRAKGGGFLRKQEAEKIVFISKVYYPFWLVSLNEASLLLDGLNIASHTITHRVLPDLKGFKEKLKDLPSSRQIQANFLSNNQNYFQGLDEEQKIVIDGLIKDQEFTTEFLKYVNEGIKTNSPINDAVLISPALDKDGVTRMLRNLEKKRQELLEELSDMMGIIKLLNSKNQESQASLIKEIQVIEKEYNTKIEKVKATVETKIAKINKAFEKEETEISKKFEQQIKDIEKEIVKCEKTTEQIDSEIEQTEAEIRTAAINKDDVAEQKWKDKRNELKDNKPEYTLRIKELQKEILNIEEARKSILFKLNQDKETKIKEESKDLVELEAAREAASKICRNEMAKIEEMTSNIIEKIDKLEKRREGVMLEFDELDLKQIKETVVLVFMPFYLSCYQSKSKKRYSYVSPSIVSYGGLGVRLKSLGKTKITQLCQPRNRKISILLNSLMSLLDENIVFNHEISEACLKANLLHNKKDQEAIVNGLNRLKEQQWLSSSEFETFSQALSQYS